MIKRFWELGLVLLVLLTIAGLTMAGGQVYKGITDRTADGVIGQPGFLSSYSGTSDTMLNTPYSCAVDKNNNLWVADYNNDRVLRFSASGGVVSDTTADLVIGQAGYYAAISGTSDTMIDGPFDLGFDPNGNLYVMDAGNLRVLRFDADTATGLVTDTTADQVFGQAGFFAKYSGVSDTMANASDGGLDVDKNGHLYLSCYSNDRIVRWNADSDGTVRDTTIDLVFGQASFFTTYQGISDTLINGPQGIGSDANGNFYMASYSNDRILRWDASSTGTVNDTTADFVWCTLGFYVAGAEGLSDTMIDDPYGVTFDPLGNMWVFDQGNNRILRFDAGGDTTADFVIGGGDPNGGFDSSISGTSDTMLSWAPFGRFSPNGQLYVTDGSNSRILRFGPMWDILSDDDDCFLATAAYGQDARELSAFHQFRDEVLMTNRIGRGLVSFYYTHGPSAASYVGGDASRFATRAVLTPVLGLVKIINTLGLLGAGILLTLIGGSVFALRRR